MNDKAIYSADDLNILKRENQSLRSELQKQKEEIANHIAVNSLLTDSEGEADLANKLYQCQSELAKQKELNTELVEYLKLARTDMIKLGMDPGHNHVHKISSAIKRAENLKS